MNFNDDRMGSSQDFPCILNDNTTTDALAAQDEKPTADGAGTMTVPAGRLLRSKVTVGFLALAFAFAMAAFYGASTLPWVTAEKPADVVCAHPQSVKGPAAMGFLPCDNMPAGLAEARECAFVGSVTTVLETWKLIGKIFHEMPEFRDQQSWYSTNHYHFALTPGASPSITISYRQLII